MQKLDLENFFVYSTEPQESQAEDDIQDDVEPASMSLLVRKEKKGRGGKVVTVVEGFEGSDEAMKKLAKDLKQHCGTGGAVKGDDIIIQGDLAVKIVQYLESRGYPAKKTTM
ncbi:MAG: translation initiation factor [Bacteroidia bacterium]